MSRQGDKRGDRKAHRSRKAMEGDDRRGNRNKDERLPLNSPKWDDTPEAEEMKKELTRINQQIRATQGKMKKAQGDAARAVRAVHQKVGNKEEIIKRIADRNRRIVVTQGALDGLAQEAKKQSDVVSTKRAFVAKISDQLLAKRSKGEKDKEFVAKNVAAIQRRVEELELRLGTATMSIVEEKETMREIKRVRNLRNLLPTYLERQESYRQENGILRGLEKQVDSKTKMVARYKQEISDLEEELATMEKKVEEVKDSTTEVEGEKQGIEGELERLTKAYQAQATAIRETRDAWYQARRDAAAAKRAQLNEKRARERAENAEKEAAFKKAARAEKRELVPFYDQISNVKGLISYVRTLRGDDAAEAAAALKAASEADAKAIAALDMPEGAQLIGKKVTEEEDFFVGSGKKSKRNKKGRKKRTPNIVHHVKTLKQFKQAGVKVPATQEDLTPALESLQAKLDDWEAKSKVEKAKILAEIAKEEEEDARREAIKAKAAADLAAKEQEEAAATEAGKEDAEADAEPAKEEEPAKEDK